MQPLGVTVRCPRLCINLTGLRDAQGAGKALFLGVSVKASLGEIGRRRREGGSRLCGWHHTVC